MIELLHMDGPGVQLTAIQLASPGRPGTVTGRTALTKSGGPKVCYFRTSGSETRKPYG